MALKGLHLRLLFIKNKTSLNSNPFFYGLNRQQRKIMPLPDFDLKYLQEELSKLPHDPHVYEYKDLLLSREMISRFLTMPNQFFHLTDLVSDPAQVVYISPNFERISGFSWESPFNLERIYQHIHPADRLIVLKAAIRSMQAMQYAPQSIPGEYIFENDFRFITAEGETKRLLRQTGMITKDKNNNLVHSFAIYTDITHLKNSNNISFSMHGPPLKGYDYPGKEVEELMKSIFSPREKEILKLLIQGKNSKDIAQELFISEHTVNRHRRNMLKKTRVNNTNELVAFGLDHELIQST